MSWQWPSWEEYRKAPGWKRHRTRRFYERFPWLGEDRFGYETDLEWRDRIFIMEMFFGWHRVPKKTRDRNKQLVLEMRRVVHLAKARNAAKQAEKCIKIMGGVRRIVPTIIRLSEQLENPRERLWVNMFILRLATLDVELINEATRTRLNTMSGKMLRRLSKLSEKRRYYDD